MEMIKNQTFILIKEISQPQMYFFILTEI